MSKVLQKTQIIGIGVNLRRCRMAARKPLSDVALAVGVSAISLRRMEDGIAGPGLAMLLMLANAIGCGMDELTRGLAPSSSGPSPDESSPSGQPLEPEGPGIAEVPDPNDPASSSPNPLPNLCKQCEQLNPASIQHNSHSSVVGIQTYN